MPYSAEQLIGMAEAELRRKERGEDAELTIEDLDWGAERAATILKLIEDGVGC